MLPFLSNVGCHRHVNKDETGLNGKGINERAEGRSGEGLATGQEAEMTAGKNWC